MKLIQLIKPLELTIRKNWGIAFSIVTIIILLFFRVNSHKYSQDTLVAFELMHSILFHFNTLIYTGADGWANSFNYHFNLIYIVISPIYFLGPSLMIFLWKLFCYGGFLVIVWRLVSTDHRNDVSGFHKNLFLIMIALHPTFVSNVISPDIWDSDLILPLLSLSILCISREKYSWAVFWICVTFLVKEDMMLVGIFYGVLLAIIAKKLKFIWLSVFSLGWFYVVTQLFMPSFAVSPGSLGLLKFSFGNLGNSMGEVILNSIIQPSLLIANGLWMRKFASLAIIFSCFGFLPLWRKRSLIYMIPGISVLGYTIIAMQPYLDYSKHYMLALFVFVVWSSYESYIATSNTMRAKLVPLSIFVSVSVIVVLQLNIRVWSYYFTPVENYAVLKSVEKRFIPPNSTILTGGLSSPWICYQNRCPIGSGFFPDEIGKVKYDYILINLNSIFWESLNCTDDTMALNLKKLNSNLHYRSLFYDNDIILLKKVHIADNILQPDWSGDFAKYQKINHDCLKSDLMRGLRLL